MQLIFTEEQEQFRDIVRRFTRSRSPITEVRRLMETDTGFDDDVWRMLTGELALTALRIPEAHGGSGFGPVELGVVMEEFGRSLICVPYFSSAVLATEMILAVGTEVEQAALLPGLADGSRRGAFALPEGAGSWDPAEVECSATQTIDGWTLTGRKRFVIDGHTADFLLIAARTGPTVGLFKVDAGSRGLERTLLTSMDQTRKLADVSCSDTPAIRLGDSDDATDPINAALDAGSIALASEMAGGAQALLDSAVEYAKMRVQFGRTIGSFQAIKHKCADMLLDVESAKSAAYCAAAACAAGDPEAPALASLAKAAASDTYIRTAAETIQIHGGIGFTWENDTHLWFKRAKSSEVMLGSAGWHRERLMQRWGY